MSLLFNFGLGHAFRRVQVNQNCLKLNGNQLLVYAGDVNALGGSVHTIEKNAEALVVGSKETRIQVNADKTKYTVMSRDQNARRSHNYKTNNGSFERVGQFKYLGTNLPKQNSIQEDIKSRLKSGNACYHSVRNLLSFSLLNNDLKIKT